MNAILKGLEDRLGLPNTGLLPPIVDRIRELRRDHADTLANNERLRAALTDAGICIVQARPHDADRIIKEALAVAESKGGESDDYDGGPDWAGGAEPF